MFYDTNVMIKNEWCKNARINPKAQVIFIHTIVNAIFKYIMQLNENTKKLSNNNIEVFGHIKAHYDYYETTKNGNLHIHTLL